MGFWPGFRTYATDEAKTIAPMPTPPPPLVDKASIAGHFSVTTRTVDNWAKRGMPYVQLPGARRYDLADVRRWLATSPAGTCAFGRTASTPPPQRVEVLAKSREGGDPMATNTTTLDDDGNRR